MDASQPPNSRRQASGKRTRSVRWLALLAGCLVLLLGLALQVFGFSQPSIAYGASATHFDSTSADAAPTSTATPAATATTAAIPPTLTLAVPASGQGPVGAHLTIIGSNWSAADVLVGAASPGASCADPATWAQTFNHVRPQADQSIIFTFDWPTNLGLVGSTYSICASNSAGTVATPYQVLSSSPPTFQLDTRTTHAGALVTLTGTGFVGTGSVTLTVTDAQGNTRTLTALSPDGNGGFSLQYQPRPTDVGDVTLQAFTGAPQGMQPAIQLSAKLHVDGASTPTMAATATTVVVAPATPPPVKSDGSSTALIVALVVGILLTMLAIVGAVLFFVMRNRRNPDDGSDFKSGYYGGSSPGYGGSNPGYGRAGAMYGDTYQGNGYGGGMGNVGSMGTPGWDATAQNGYPSYDQGYDQGYGQGGYPPQPGYGPEAGGWPESDEPDPGWRPRPMTGQWRASDDYAGASYGNYGADESGQYPPQQYPPQDPWGTPDDSYGQPGQTGQPYGGAQNYGGAPRDEYDGGYDGGYGANYGGGAGYPPPSPGGYPPAPPRGRTSGGGPTRSSGGGPGRASGGGAGRGSSGGPRDTPRGRFPEPPPPEEGW